eukprot:1194929-Prorocentrum_minimum.AAC.5
MSGRQLLSKRDLMKVPPPRSTLRRRATWALPNPPTLAYATKLRLAHPMLPSNSTTLALTVVAGCVFSAAQAAAASRFRRKKVGVAVSFPEEEEDEDGHEEMTMAERLHNMHNTACPTRLSVFTKSNGNSRPNRWSVASEADPDPETPAAGGARVALCF